MLIFDHDAARWTWELNPIHAKNSDNVVDLMVGKLNRLLAETQKACTSWPAGCAAAGR